MENKIYSKIAGSGSALPRCVLKNEDFEKVLDTSDEWITERTGIKQRHLAGQSETTVLLAYHAAQEAMHMASADVNEIDLIIVATTTPDKVFPSTACLLQNELGTTNHCPAFDVQAVCSGFLYALDIANRFIQSSASKCALVVGSEVFSRILDWKDRSTCVLFGDGAGAVVLRSSPAPGILASELHADGSRANILYAAPKCGDSTGPATVFMDGREVYRSAVCLLTEAAQSVLKTTGLSVSDIDWLIPHQANQRIIDQMAHRISLPMESVVSTISQHGNTSAASIPLALDTALRDGRIQQGNHILLAAVGGGLTWGAAVVQY